MGDGVVELVLQFGDGARGWLGVEVLFQGFVEAVEFAAVCGWYGREDRYLTPSSPSIGGQGCVRVELGDGQPIPMHGCCLLEARRGEITLGGRAIQPRSRTISTSPSSAPALSWMPPTSLTRGEIRARLHARGHPRFELIGLAPIDLDGAITVVHPSARDECETPAVPAVAERLHDRRTR